MLAARSAGADKLKAQSVAWNVSHSRYSASYVSSPGAAESATPRCCASAAMIANGGNIGSRDAGGNSKD